MTRPEERLRELPDDARAAESRERIVAAERRDHRAIGKRRPGPVMVGDDDLQTESLRGLDLGDGRDAAVDGEDEVEPVLGEPREGLAVQSVALLESRREVPRR